MSASTRRKVNKTSSKLPTGEIKLNGKVHKRNLGVTLFGLNHLSVINLQRKYLEFRMTEEIR